MHNIKLIIGIIAAGALVGGSSVIVYTGRPVMQLRNVNEAASGTPAGEVVQPSAPPLAAVGEIDDEDEDEEEEEDGDDNEGGAAATPVAPVAPAPSTPASPTTPPSGGTANAPGTYAMADVAAHATEANCWSAVNGIVYDLTTWVARHPGGRQRIIGICGIDGSVAFNDQHTGSSKAQSMLVLLKIGTLR
jgi:cytochrome b involved in lipid metabolism